MKKYIEFLQPTNIEYIKMIQTQEEYSLEVLSELEMKIVESGLLEDINYFLMLEEPTTQKFEIAHLLISTFLPKESHCYEFFVKKFNEMSPFTFEANTGEMVDALLDVDVLLNRGAIYKDEKEKFLKNKNQFQIAYLQYYNDVNRWSDVMEVFIDKINHAHGCTESFSMVNDLTIPNGQLRKGCLEYIDKKKEN